MALQRGASSSNDPEGSAKFEMLINFLFMNDYFFPLVVLMLLVSAQRHSTAAEQLRSSWYSTVEHYTVRTWNRGLSKRNFDVITFRRVKSRLTAQNTRRADLAIRRPLRPREACTPTPHLPNGCVLIRHEDG